MKKTILVVEDDTALKIALYKKLKEEEFSVLEADNGVDGLEIAKKSHPDLILLDIIMPVMDGMTMLKELRKDEWGKNAVVIFLTNLSEEGAIAQATELGSFGYLIKTDWSLSELVKKIKEKLNK